MSHREGNGTEIILLSSLSSSILINNELLFVLHELFEGKVMEFCGIPVYD